MAVNFESSRTSTDRRPVIKPVANNLQPLKIQPLQEVTPPPHSLTQPANSRIEASRNYTAYRCFIVPQGPYGQHAIRVIPEGTIKGAHVVQTSDFVQVTGGGDFMKLNIHNDDADGELDRNGHDLSRNPLGDFIYSSAFCTDMWDQVFHSTGAAHFVSGLVIPPGRWKPSTLMGTATFHPGDAFASIPSYSQCTTISSIGGTTATGSPA
ncbi:hypothetical protein ARMGADRAFT_1029982 [Armillaria gallica]|uniref:Uncharacterized protein n=1 Tax=Armillaria gallica TaxID=47427 RepID=A0A2H3E3B6_ARMGA|nr:hypothetical protein ARMGADRAFT_1029982 [Armillaria gallica]